MWCQLAHSLAGKLVLAKWHSVGQGLPSPCGLSQLSQVSEGVVAAVGEGELLAEWQGRWESTERPGRGGMPSACAIGNLSVLYFFSSTK